ncbi:MAG: hypothetical protein JXR94_15630, partial [Candidatus Hydrogenedentes bacterium]|nr:hypothetical protein [Candidatus Hydrogenedentota bacterium]
MRYTNGMCLLIVLGCAAASCGTPSGIELARFPVNGPYEGTAPPGVTVSYEEQGGVDGAGALVVAYTGTQPVSVPLFQVDGPEASRCAL